MKERWRYRVLFPLICRVFGHATPGPRDEEPTPAGYVACRRCRDMVPARHTWDSDCWCKRRAYPNISAEDQS